MTTVEELPVDSVGMRLDAPVSGGEFYAWPAEVDAPRDVFVHDGFWERGDCYG